MHRIVFLDRATIAPQITLRQPRFENQWTDYDRTAPAELVPRLAEADIAVLNKVPLRADAIASLPRLRMVAVAATGTDCVDVADCRARGIVVSNIRGYAINTVPEHTFGLILALRRSLVGYRQAVLDGRWQGAGQFCFFDHPIADLQGATLGIIGEGVLGRRVAALGHAFGMRTLFFAHKGRQGQGALYTPWDEALAASDVITLHAPLTPETRGMIGLRDFERMAKRPLIVNTARGGLIVEEDLELALDRGLIAGTGIDVTMPEPPPADSPLMRIAKRPNVIVTPHVAWASDQAQQVLADQLIDNIEAFVAGRPQNLV